MAKPHFSLALLGLLVVAGCGRETTEVGHKLAGVGSDPTEVGPEPVNYGGLIAYDWVEFAGAGLPLGMLGLVAYDAVGPDFGTFEQPYALVTGTGFVFESDLPNTDTLFGAFGVAPAAEGTCYTNIDPRSYLSGVADVGQQIRFSSEDGRVDYRIGRRPIVYGPDVSAAFPYYIDIAAWRTAPRYFYKPTGGETLDSLQETVLQGVNYEHGTRVFIDFPGAIPDNEASFGSIPMPLSATASDEARSFRLPSKPTGLMLSWNGPAYDAQGQRTGETEERSTCVQYTAHDEQPTTPDDCLTYAPFPTEGEEVAPDDPFNDEVREPTVNGQIYTGPWDTTDGSVTFSWKANPDQTAFEAVTVSVRFLAPVDEDDENKLERVMFVGADGDIEDDWEALAEDGLIPESAAGETPEGRREAFPCEDEEDGAEWVFDDSLRRADGEYIASLRGEPTHTLAEVTCRLSEATPDENGNVSFTVTNDILENAVDYAKRNNSQGAVFTFARTTDLDLDTPDVRDRYGNKRAISDVKVTSNAVVLGRFWYQQ
jgi:hypothetical protein